MLYMFFQDSNCFDTLEMVALSSLKYRWNVCVLNKEDVNTSNTILCCIVIILFKFSPKCSLSTKKKRNVYNKLFELIEDLKVKLCYFLSSF